MILPDSVHGLPNHVLAGAGAHKLKQEAADAHAKVTAWDPVTEGRAFLERHPEVAHNAAEYLNRFARHVPRQPSYLGRRGRGAKLEKRWTVLVPEHLSTGAGFEGSPR